MASRTALSERVTDGRPIVLLGGSGLLGTALRAEIGRRGLSCVAPLREELDLAIVETLEPGLRALSASVVINTVAFTDVARAEREDQRRQVYALNRDAPDRLARVCRGLGAPLVHFSTDYVFDGRKREPYREDDAVGPLQVYGQSKLEGERRVLEAHAGALVVRTSTLFGRGQSNRLHYVDAVLRQARSRGKLEVVRLPVASPTYTPDLARGVLDLLEAGSAGLVHVVNHGGCSRLELTREAVAFCGLANRVEVLERPEPVGSLVRPSYAVLETSRFTALTGRTLRPWRQALHDYLGSQPDQAPP